MGTFSFYRGVEDLVQLYHLMAILCPGICPILKQIHTWEYDGIWHILVAKQMSQHHTIYSASEALQEP